MILQIKILLLLKALKSISKNEQFFKFLRCTMLEKIFSFLAIKSIYTVWAELVEIPNKSYLKDTLSKIKSGKNYLLSKQTLI